MPDISMCRDEDCPVRHTCYRYVATPTPQWQCYFQPPRKLPNRGGAYYWPVDAAYVPNE